jgi:hypothetical protein
MINFNFKFMARNKKSVLNQILEPKQKEVVETEKVNVEDALLTPEEDLDEFDMSVHSEVYPPEEKITFTNDPIEIDLMKEETESPVYEDDGEEDGETEEEPKPRTIESLSYKELRLFQRTGQMPK